MTKPVSYPLVEGFPARSFPSSSGDHRFSLRFFLTAAELEALERHRHAQNTDPFQLYVGITGILAGIQTHNTMEPG